MLLYETDPHELRNQPTGDDIAPIRVALFLPPMSQAFHES